MFSRLCLLDLFLYLPFFFPQQVSVPQQTYQQPVFVSCQPGQAAVAVAGMQPCYSLLPPNQHTTMRYPD